MLIKEILSIHFDIAISAYFLKAIRFVATNSYYHENFIIYSIYIIFYR